MTFEALIGQVFLVTLVARLMSLYGMERRQPAPVDVDVDAGTDDQHAAHAEKNEPDDSDLEE